MDPFTAALILGVVMSGAQMYMGVQVQKQQAGAIYQQQQDQEAARVEQVKKEMGVAAQRSNTALAGAASRKTSATTPQYAVSQSVLGGVSQAGNSMSPTPNNNTSNTSGNF